MLPPPPQAGDGVAIDALRAALHAAGFTADAVEERLGTHEFSSRAIDVAVYLRRLGDDAFSTLARLFLLGAALDAGRVAEALAPLEPEQLQGLGVVELEEGDVRPLVRIAPHGDYYVCSDGAALPDAPYDYVPGIHSPSVTLAKLTVRKSIRSALDLGTGCGIQALLAAKHAERVVATDVNPRALAFAKFNARLNDVDSIDFRLGNAFEPVAGVRFDLVVSNPPYVISPDTSYAYRDSELPADELCRRIVGDAPAFLTEGGFAHVLVSWAHELDGDWAAPLREWVRGSECDAWLLHYRTSDPLAHAAGWLRSVGEADPQRYEEGLDRWVAGLGRLDIEAIGYGAIVLRRRSAGRAWVREDPLPLDRLEPAGDHTLRVFAGQDALERLGDEELLATRLALTQHHRLEQELAAVDGGFTVRSQVLELTDGLRLTVGIDRHTASLLPQLDGEQPLREALAAAATTFELDDSEREHFVPAALPVVRRLLQLGFLVVVADGR